MSYHVINKMKLFHFSKCYVRVFWKKKVFLFTIISSKMGQQKIYFTFKQDPWSFLYQIRPFSSLVELRVKKLLNKWKKLLILRILCDNQWNILIGSCFQVFLSKFTSVIPKMCTYHVENIFNEECFGVWMR